MKTWATLVAATMSLAAAPPRTADQLVAAVLDAAKTTGLRIHATMTVTAAGAREPAVHQLVVSARRDGRTADAMYQQLWAGGEKGRALVLDDRGDHRLRGFEYRPGGATRIDSRMFAERFFDSDLTLEDLAEAFWLWPSRTVVGQEAIGEYQCVIVELRPPAGAETAYSSVKAWIAPDIAVALRVETFGADGHLAKRIGLYRVTRVGERWVPTILTVEPAAGRSRTVIEGARVEQDLHLHPIDFTLSRAKAGVVVRSK